MNYRSLYQSKYFSSEKTVLNVENGFTVEILHFKPHFFDSFGECCREAMEASRHLSKGYYYAFEPREGMFSFVFSTVIGEVCSHHMDTVFEEAKKREKRLTNQQTKV